MFFIIILCDICSDAVDIPSWVYLSMTMETLFLLGIKMTRDKR